MAFLEWLSSWGAEALVVLIVAIGLFIFGASKEKPWWYLGPTVRIWLEERDMYRTRYLDALGLVEKAVATTDKAVKELPNEAG